MEHPPSDYDSTRTYIYTHKYIKWLSHQGKLFISPRIGWRENLKETPNMIFLLWVKTQSFLWIHCRFSLKPNEFLSAMLDEPCQDATRLGAAAQRMLQIEEPRRSPVGMWWMEAIWAMDRVTSLWPLKLPEIMVGVWGTPTFPGFRENHLPRCHGYSHFF